MRTVNVGINELHGKVLWLGYVGENEHTQIVLDCTPVFSEYPAAVPAVTVQPPYAQPYPAIVSRDGNNVVWFITDSDLIHCGKGEMQVTFTENGVVVKSRIVNVSIGRSIEPTGVVPEPIENWLVEANTALNAIPQTINDALEGAKESGEFDGFSPTATVSKIGDTATISITDKEGTTTAQVKDGAKGDPGTPGQDGFSPIATVTKSDDTATISITDKNGTTTATVKDGKDGTPGQDGYSPTATVTKSGSVATISITDENGTTTATVTDGQDGDTGATPVISIGTVSTLTPGSDATASMDTTDPAHPVLSLGIPEGEPGNATIDDTSTANNRVWSAQKVNGLLGAVPSGKTLQGQVSDLKSAIGALGTSVDGTKNYIEGKKLITASGATRGDVTDDANFSVSELIPMSAMPSSGNTIKVDYGTISENTMFALYNSQGVYIDSWGLSSSDTNRAFTFSYTSYTDLTYVRFAFKKGYSAKITSQNGKVTYWTIQSVGGLLNDVDALESTVSGLSSTFMQTNTYIDFSMVNRLDPSECEVNTIVTPSTGAVDSYNGYFTTDFIQIRTGETLYFYRFDTKGIKGVRMFAAYDADKNVIPELGSTSEVTSITQSGNMAYIRASLPYVASDYARTPEDTAALANANPIYIPGYGNSPVIKTQYIERHTMWVRSTDTEAQIIQKLVDAFNTGNVDVYFERATYQFGTELAKVNTDYGMIHNEIPIGNGCRYYFNGSTLIATIDLTQHPAVGNDEFYCNFFGCQRRPSSYELHDGVLIATDTRYVVHDESSAMEGAYRHLYQNMEMHYHTNLRQENIRKCIGGGTGASGVVEIIGCKFTTDAQDSCVSFHGNGTDVVGAEFGLNVRSCWFSNNIRAGELSANQTGRFYYTGNSAASEPATYDRWTVTKFLNEVRT